MVVEEAVAGVLTVFLLVALLVLLAVAFVIALVVFWIWMLVDCLTREFDKESDKIVWAIVIIFVQLLGAIIYYFVVKRKDSKAVKKENKTVNGSRIKKRQV